MGDIDISASIVTYNSNHTAVSAVKSIADKTKKYPFKTFVFDNGSTDNTVELLRETGLCMVIENKENLGFGKAHNRIINEDIGRYLFIVNPDIVLSNDAMSDMVDFMEENPDVVMAMPRLINENGTEQFVPKERPTARRLFLGRISKKIRAEYCWTDKRLDGPAEIDFCSGCFFVIRSEIFKKLGGFDERFFMYLEDGDLTLRAKKYGRVMVLPDITVIHKWDRASAKSIKYLMIHTLSCFKFLLNGRNYK